MSAEAWRAEPPDACTSTLGIAPFRVRIGMALGLDRGFWEEPGVVIWQESGVEGEWGKGVCFQARYVHFAVAEATTALGVTLQTLKDYCSESMD